jgi:hypothetical protein
MVRRDPARIREARRLFGRNGLKRDAESWTSWLREQGDDGEAALTAIDELVARGANRVMVVGLLMELHASDRFPPARLNLLRNALDKAVALRAHVRALAKTQLRGPLHLEYDGSAPTFEGEVIRFVSDARRVLAYTQRGDTPLFDHLLGQLVTHVAESTGKHADDILNDAVNPIIRRPFDTAKWRDRNKAWWSAPKKAESP